MKLYSFLVFMVLCLSIIDGRSLVPRFEFSWHTDVNNNHSHNNKDNNGNNVSIVPNPDNDNFNTNPNKDNTNNNNDNIDNNNNPNNNNNSSNNNSDNTNNNTDNNNPNNDINNNTNQNNNNSSKTDINNDNNNNNNSSKDSNSNVNTTSTITKSSFSHSSHSTNSNSNDSSTPTTEASRSNNTSIDNSNSNSKDKSNTKSKRGIIIVSIVGAGLVLFVVTTIILKKYVIKPSDHFKNKLDGNQPMSEIFNETPYFNRPSVPDFFNTDRPVSMGSTVSSSISPPVNGFANHPMPYGQRLQRPSMSSLGCNDNYNTYIPPPPQPVQIQPPSLYHPSSMSSLGSEYSTLPQTIQPNSYQNYQQPITNNNIPNYEGNIQTEFPNPPQHPPRPLSQSTRRSSLGSVHSNDNEMGQTIPSPPQYPHQPLTQNVRRSSLSSNTNYQ